MVKSEEKIDIWNKQNSKKIQEDPSLPEKKDNNSGEQINLIKKDKPSSQQILIEEAANKSDEEIEVFGIYDPAEFNFNLNMWSSTEADEIRASFKRLEKIKLSETSNEILENILLSFSYPPIGMSEKEFVKLKINWLIQNDRQDLIENFLKRNKDFEGKSTLVQYLVDQNISQADIKKG